MKSKPFRYAWGISILIFVSLACNFVSNIGEQVGNVRNTAESVATDVQTGRNVIATVQGVATQLGESGLLETGQAVATQLEESGALGTARAIVTEQGPAAIATMQAFATEQGPGLIETAQAFATSQGPGLLQTAESVATRVSGMEAPDDIPVLESGAQNLVANPSIVSYLTTESLPSVIDFYQREMPVNGWVQNEERSAVSEDVAALYYEKAGRVAVVNLSTNPLDGQTIVLINIQ